MTDANFLQMDISKFDWFVSDAAGRYEKSSPVVETWLDQVCERVRLGSITVKELRRVQSLYEDGVWLDAHSAGNTAYKMMSEYGVLPAGVTIAY